MKLIDTLSNNPDLREKINIEKKEDILYITIKGFVSRYSYTSGYPEYNIYPTAEIELNTLHRKRHFIGTSQTNELLYYGGAIDYKISDNYTSMFNIRIGWYDSNLTTGKID